MDYEENMKSDKLLPCPFCGAKARLIEDFELMDQSGNVAIHYVQCTKCHIRTPNFDEWDIGANKAKQKARDCWNKRK